ncbi:hypothetical protein Tco_1518175 [Tanacetum coccineum]
MDFTVEQWLDLIYGDHKTVDVKIKNEVVSNWLTIGDNEVEFTNTESFDPDDENLIKENEVAEIFRIETNVFDFEKPTGHSKGPTCSWKNDGYCNGENLPGAYIVGNILGYQDLEWYEDLKDGKLKDKALKNKAIMEGIIDEEEESNNEVWRRWGDYDYTTNNHEKNDCTKTDEEGYELFNHTTHERSVCEIRRFAIIKYSFGEDEKYVARKEHEYNDLMRTNEDACWAYQEIFRSIDEGWVVTRAE